MKPRNIKRRKASEKWCDFHEDLTNDCLSLKVRVDRHHQKGEPTEYKKEQSYSVMVVSVVPGPIKYINMAFTRVNAVTKG